MRLVLTGALVAAALAAPDAATIHREAILIDTHNDVPMKVARGYDLGTPTTLGSTDIRKLRAGGVDAVFFAAYVPARYARSGGSAAYCRKIMDAIRTGVVGRHPGVFTFARTAADIETAAREGKIAALIGIEGGHAIEDSLDKLREFHALGAQYMTLTHSNTNNWADSSGSRARHGGLTAFGEQVVAEMNRLGMIVDVSHVSDETFADVLRISKAPVFASHSSCRAISKHKRNMSDDMLRGLARNGGVIQINFACDFISERSRTTDVAAKRALERKYGSDLDRLRADVEKQYLRASIDEVVAHIDHAVKVAGVDHVGIGSDYDGINCTPTGLEDVSKFPTLTAALVKRGYTAEQVRKILGGNTLRLMRSVEKAAQRRS